MKIAYCIVAVIFIGSLSYDLIKNPLWEPWADIVFGAYALFKAIEPEKQPAK